MIAPPTAKIIALAAKLEAGFGTDCDLADEIDELTTTEAQQLDMLVFECATCNHWFRQHENATPDAAKWVCKDCV